MNPQLEKAREQIQGTLGLARPYLPHAAALFVFALLGWGNGYFQSTKAIGNPNLKDTWILPTWAPSQAGPDREKFAALDIWDGQKGKAQKKVVVTDTKAWKLVGTVRTGKNYAALIQVDEGRVQRLLLGDALPNGEKVIGVTHGTLKIESNGAEQEIKLFSPGNQDKLEKK